MKNPLSYSHSGPCSVTGLLGSETHLIRRGRTGASELLVRKPPRIGSDLEVEDGDVGILAELEDIHGHVHVGGIGREHLQGGAVFEFGDEAEVEVSLDANVETCVQRA